ncbi:MAG: lysylphosphatidylglycerol synthase transmembrane domain-containing protein, partial [Thermoanaerobaculia bacterium]|nr:lysylphosphatidylglycerol synthase transmembrane domain-containing protein [Thermoanaerobaculia bacterium]
MGSSARHAEPGRGRPRRRRRRRRLRRALEALLAGAALYLAVRLISETGWAALTAQIRSADPAWVAITCALLTGRWAVWASRWRLALERRLPGSSWWHAAATILAGAAVNHLTPTFRVFGGLLRARYLGGPDRHRFTAAYGSVLFDQIVTQTVIGLLTTVAFVLVAWRLGRLDQMLAGLVAVVAFALLVPVLLSRLRRRRLIGGEGSSRLDDLSDRLGALWRRIQEVLRSLEVLLRDLRLLT